ncbi:trifunctional serine/threonine-protein kinase/ATP-binding protein/sensor histidine kinase [Argonema antarcticum]|uniref:trifunctional serine/threonine-protein kinase/ATP-binding protein/sensor histidine kinase n=1 Tax=Argonema antarcticum TaxID=2942763 RepID=UPI002012D6B2|nr:ATP-binding sensor histidine kinase [Argonema antarcticum]MCL1472479.1 AAA family ATPase [Argonema antarcticum A004/B2]
MNIRAGYKLIEKINEGLNTVVYRAERKEDKKAAIVKILRADYPTLEEIMQLRHEYEISRNLNLEGIVKPYSLENHRNGLALILEDSSGEALNKFLCDRKLELTEFLNIGIELADTLGKLHDNQIIHKDIKPTNIIINPTTLKVKITDFSIATRLSRETQALSHPTLLEGTLAYISPEQTGRMNRSIDYRTDFYSLGVTFYEILCGELPFKATDPMELVHCHIAKQPVPPHQVRSQAEQWERGQKSVPTALPGNKVKSESGNKIQNSEIPKAISDIVMKLLAKTAEDRYQSAYGLKADLEQCLSQLQQTGQISHFIPGQRDKSGQFLIPQKLYGRETQVATLMDAFDRVSSGTAEMMLVSGYSGIGKSCLVYEVHKPIVAARGYFIAGKFDQFKRNIPYAALIQAFQELIRQLLTESPEKIIFWKQKILKALGQNARVIIDVIPELELIVGVQPEVSQLGANESQNRFNLVFKQFIHIFTQKAHPLVLFLDDLQWADSASLKLVQLLLTDQDSQYLLLIGAYRDNEVSPTHPFMQTLDKIHSSGSIVNNIILPPLALSTVSQLVADTLGESSSSPVPSLASLSHKQGELEGECLLASQDRNETEKCPLLAELVFNKTQGNPFFLTQLLTSLYAEKLLTFDFNIGSWQWDIGRIQTIGIADYNVVELIARNIQKLPPDTQKILKLAACIGNRFNLDVLAIVNEQSISETASALWDGLQSGLILPIGEGAYKIPLLFKGNESLVMGNSQENKLEINTYKVSYKFLHDRVQQAAYSLIPTDDQKATHLKIGQLLLQNTNQDELEENVFDIVNQLNVGVEFITDPEEKYKLAQLNLIAARKAKAATAYEAAITQLRVGLELLAENSWQSNYDLTLGLYVEAVEAEYLNTNYERSATLAEVVLQQANTLLEKVKVYELQIQFYMAQNQMLKAIDTGLQVLDMLGVSLSNEADEGGFSVKLPSLTDLENIPEMTDPYQLAALRILISIISPAYTVKPDIVPLLVLTQTKLCVEHGHSALAAFAYAFYGIFIYLMTENINAGYHAGQLALKLLDKFNARELQCKVYNLFHGVIRPWKVHVKDTLTSLREGVQSGQESGDIEYVSYNATVYCASVFLIGDQLDIVEQQQRHYLNLALKLKQDYSIYYIKIFHQLTLNLQKKADGKCQLVGESFDETQMLPVFIETNNRILLFILYLVKTILFYFFKEFNSAVATASLAVEHGITVMSMIVYAVHNFYYSLALLSHYPKVSSSEQQKYLAIVDKNQQKMRRWADSAPSNFKHKYELVEAEKARVLGQILEAMEYYDRAIMGAKEQGYLQEEALASELAAEFYFSLGRDKFAQIYLTQAYYGYVHWGAKAKAKDLESRYPAVFSEMLKREPIAIQTNRTTTSTTGGSSAVLDLSTVNKASLALAEEIVLDKLLDKLLRIVMENAGATTSCLILEKDGHLLIEATGNVDKNEVLFWSPTPIETTHNLPVSVINYVAISKENVVLNDAAISARFATDTYIEKNKTKSILCTPLINQGNLIGIIYLENNITNGAFTTERLEVLKILSSQVAISLKNAILYGKLDTTSQNLRKANEQLEDYNRSLEQKVEERTLELQEKNRLLRQQATQLELALKELQATQTQLIQTEKMSSLGQMVAGIAHEINNPINFIYGNLIHATEYFQDLLKLLDFYEQHSYNATSEIKELAKTIDLEFIVSDFPRLINSMQVGADRIRQIVLSLRNFSRLDEAAMKSVDIHEGIDSALLLLQNRLKARPEHPGIDIVKEYSQLPGVECYASFLNQVFMNILSNAIDAIEESFIIAPVAKQKKNGLINIRTCVIKGDKVEIRIADNGSGMTEEICRRVFDPFFTTKPVGSGTGLGLAISYQIVVEKHQGRLTCISAPGQGAEFVVEIPLKQKIKHNEGEVLTKIGATPLSTDMPN